jgi:hypothetical protein
VIGIINNPAIAWQPGVFCVTRIFTCIFAVSTWVFAVLPDPLGVTINYREYQSGHQFCRIIPGAGSGYRSIR